MQPPSARMTRFTQEQAVGVAGRARAAELVDSHLAVLGRLCAVRVILAGVARALVHVHVAVAAHDAALQVVLHQPHVAAHAARVPRSTRAPAPSTRKSCEMQKCA